MDGSLEKDLVFSTFTIPCFRGTCVHSRSVEYDGGCSLEKDLVFSSQWHVSEAHVYTLGVWNMMEGVL